MIMMLLESQVLVMYPAHPSSISMFHVYCWTHNTGAWRILIPNVCSSFFRGWLKPTTSRVPSPSVGYRCPIISPTYLPSAIPQNCLSPLFQTRYHMVPPTSCPWKCSSSELFVDRFHHNYRGYKFYIYIYMYIYICIYIYMYVCEYISMYT